MRVGRMHLNCRRLGNWAAWGLLMSLLGCNQFPNFALQTPEPKLDGSAKPPVVAGTPSKNVQRVSQFVFFTDFDLPKTHTIFREVSGLREQVYKELQLPPSETLVNVYLFETRDSYEAFMQKKYPDLPKRRAFFVAQPCAIGGEDLYVYTYWGDRIQQDLRHELTHALLHCVIRNVPLWLDEGLAEYFEMPESWKGVNYQHLENLLRGPNGTAKVNLERLEQLTEVEQMTPAEYREAWAWVHLMLRTSPPARQTLIAYLQDLRKDNRPTSSKMRPEPLKPRLTRNYLCSKRRWKNISTRSTSAGLAAVRRHPLAKNPVEQASRLLESIADSIIIKGASEQARRLFYGAESPLLNFSINSHACPGLRMMPSSWASRIASSHLRKFGPWGNPRRSRSWPVSNGGGFRSSAVHSSSKLAVLDVLDAPPRGQGVGTVQGQQFVDAGMGEHRLELAGPHLLGVAEKLMLLDQPIDAFAFGVGELQPLADLVRHARADVFVVVEGVAIRRRGPPCAACPRRAAASPSPAGTTTSGPRRSSTAITWSHRSPVGALGGPCGRPFMGTSSGRNGVAPSPGRASDSVPRARRGCTSSLAQVPRRSARR